MGHLAAERGASVHTTDAYERDLHAAARFFRKRGHSHWRDIAEREMADFRGWLAAQHLAVTTISRKLSALRSLFKFLAARGCGPKSGVPDAGRLRRPKSLPKALTRAEVEALMEAPNLATPIGLRDRAMLELLYGAGLRVSELTALRFEDYSEPESVLRVSGKRGKTRLVPLPAGTHDWVRRYIVDARPKLMKPRADGTLFLSRLGSRLSRSRLFQIMRKCASAAGIQLAVGPHTLRHTYAVHLVQGGADLRAVQELLGHESVATTEVYTRLDIETVKRKYADAHPRSRE